VLGILEAGRADARLVAEYPWIDELLEYPWIDELVEYPWIDELVEYPWFDELVVYPWFDGLVAELGLLLVAEVLVVLGEVVGASYPSLPCSLAWVG